MKKETTLSVLKEIRDSNKAIQQLLKANNSFLAAEKAKVNPTEKSFDESKFIKITFPNKTAKEIVEECGNKLGNGKLI